MVPVHGGKLQDDTPGTNMMDVRSRRRIFDVNDLMLTCLLLVELEGPDKQIQIVAA